MNMDGVGSGDRISASAGKNYPLFWEFIEKNNQKYIHRQLSTNSWANLARPRLDAARFMWKNVPTLSFSTQGFYSPLPTYHNTRDNLSLITPEILEDMAQLLFMAVIDMANQDSLNFRK
jgi:hypothetical protein